MWSFVVQGIKLSGAELELNVGSASSTSEIFLGTLNPPLEAPLIKQELGMAILGIPLFVRKKLICRSSLFCILLSLLGMSFSKYFPGV